MSGFRKLVKPLLVLSGVLLFAALLPLRRVAGDEMAWSLQDGDLVWVLPLRVRKADVVALKDPLDPSRVVLRRAIANGGQKVRYEDGAVRVNGKRIRQTDMGTPKPYRVTKEVIWSSPPARANPYLLRTPMKPIRWSLPGKVEVPEGSWYLLADNRDGALDSRWWGPIAEDDILGVVRLRVGPTDEWRPRIKLMLPEE